MVAEYESFLPEWGMLPPVDASDVERFIALEAIGRQAMRDADYARAEQAYRGQIRIFGVNPEPYVSLALIAALRDDEQAALENVEQAIVRGFTDLLRLERTEAWATMRRHKKYRQLQARVPELIALEEAWADWKGAPDLRSRVNAASGSTRHGPGHSWSDFRTGPRAARSAPADVATLLAERQRTLDRLGRIEPVLGERIVRLWTRVANQATASALEAYIYENSDAGDLDRAIEMLLEHHSDVALQRWSVLPAGAAERLERISDLMLERSPDGPMRAEALVAGALASYSKRNRRNVLEPEARQQLVTALEEVVAKHADSDVATTAMIGLIHTEAGAGDREAAATRFERYAADDATELALRKRLGVMALELGGIPELRATAIDGKPFDATALEGKVTVIDFWATWCPPCLDEVPTLQRIDSKHGDEVVMLGINMDYADDIGAEELGGWIAAQQLPGSHLRDGLSSDSALVKSFGVREIPFSVVVGPEGDVLAVNHHGKKLEKAVAAAVKRSN